MNTVITYLNLVLILIAMAFLLGAIYRSENIFIKARTRDVRELLTPNITRYERGVRVKLIGKFILGVLFLYIALSRIDAGYVFVSKTDMYVWIAISIAYVIIAYIDFKFSSPENEDA